MNKITVEMPLVAKCSVGQCAYNVNKACHAKAITVGDAANPGCDTFFRSSSHAKEAKRIAGVGACKVSECRYNRDFECTADSIHVGMTGDRINCLTYASSS